MKLDDERKIAAQFNVFNVRVKTQDGRQEIVSKMSLKTRMFPS